MAAVRIRMLNTGGLATATVRSATAVPATTATPPSRACPAPAAAIRLDFEGIAGSSCGALLPTGHRVDEVAGLTVTLVDNGMPVVVLRAATWASPATRPAPSWRPTRRLRSTLERVRLAAGPAHEPGRRRGDHCAQAHAGGAAPERRAPPEAARTFIPHRCHDAIGVLGAVSVATAALLPEGPAAEVADLDGRDT